MSLPYLPEEIINLLQFDLKHIIRLVQVCKTLSFRIHSAKHIRISYKGKRTEGLLSWLNVLWDVDLYGTQVTDVSALGKVHTLNLSYTQVTDGSALGNIHTLYLDG